MALFRHVPGQSSPLSLAISSLATIITLLILIGGHLALVMILWFNYQGNDGLAMILEFTHLSKNAIYIAIALALLLDLWILISNKRPAKTIAK